MDPVAPLDAGTFGPPTLIAIAYNGSVVQAQWEPGTGASNVQQYTLYVSTPGGPSYQSVVPSGGATFGSVSTGQLNPSKPYTFQLCAQATGQPDACTDSLPLLQVLPTITAADYDTREVKVTWDPVNLPQVVGFTVSLFSGGNVTTEELDDPAATRCTFVLPRPLPASLYSVQVYANTGSPISSTTAPVALDTAVPALEAARYDGQSIQLVWQPALAPTLPVTGFQLRAVSADGGAAYSSLVNGSGAITGSIPIPFPLDPRKRYEVIVSAVSAGGVTASTPPQAINAALPRLRSADYDGTSLNAVWEPIDYPAVPVTAYQLVATPAGGGTAITATVDDPYASSGSIPSPAFGSTAYTFQVAAVSLGGDLLALSAGMPLLTRLPVLIGATYDGAGVQAAWVPLTGSPVAVTGYRLRVFSASGGKASVREIANPGATSGTVVLDEPPVQGWTYQVVLSALVTPESTASAAPVALLTAQPQVTEVSYDGLAIQAAWAPPLNPQVTIGAYQIVAFSLNGRPQYASQVYSPGALKGTIELQGGPLDPSGDYQIAVLAISSTLRSRSPALGLITDLPRLLASDFDGSVISSRWVPVTQQPAVSGYVLSTFSDQTAAEAEETYPNAAIDRGTVTIPGAASLPWKAQVCAYRGNVQGCSPVLDLLQAAPAVSSTQYDGEHLVASWGVVTGATSYDVAVVSGGAVLAALSTTGTSVSLGIALDPAVTYLVSVRARNAAGAGPAGAMGIITATPGITGVTAGVGTVVVTLGTVSGITSYQAALYEGDRLVAGPTAAVTAGGKTTVTLSHAVAPEATYSVRAQAVGGPLTGPVPVVSAVPVVIEARYDGTSLFASWKGVAQPGVTGYQVNITDTTAQTTTAVTTNAQELSHAITLVLTDDYQITVQAMGNATVGPPSVATDPLADSVGYFFPQASASNSAYLFRGDDRGPGPSDITVYLPQLFSNPPASIETSPFVLSKQDSPPVASLPYTLTVAQDASINVWSFTSNGIRAPLKAAYLAFLQQLETPSYGLLPGAMALVRQVIAQALPLSFAETLYYSYGFDAASGYVNLQPGMRLRVDFETRQFVNPDPQGTLTGFTGTGTSYYPISSLTTGGNPPAIFDAFLSSMTIPVVAANTGGGAGVIDLQGGRYQLPYLRMFYPPSFPSSDSGGVVGPAQNVVLLGAPTVALLEQATAQYLVNRNFTGVPNIAWTFFRGRATFIPEVACFVGGTPVHVSVGTTVRQLTQAYAPLPFGAAVTIKGFAYRRPIGNVVDAAAQVSPDYAYGRSNQVHFSFQPLDQYGYSGGLDCFDLPVLAGDAVDFEA